MCPLLPRVLSYHVSYPSAVVPPHLAYPSSLYTALFPSPSVVVIDIFRVIYPAYTVSSLTCPRSLPTSAQPCSLSHVHVFIFRVYGDDDWLKISPSFQKQISPTIKTRLLNPPIADHSLTQPFSTSSIQHQQQQQQQN